MRHVILEKDQKKTSFEIPTTEAWQKIAEEIAETLKPGDILALSGELGAGKTTFVQALARALHISKQPQSPTFALMRAYDLPESMNGILRLIHVDAYRIEKEQDLLPLDLDEELADGKSILVVEWPEKIASWLSTRRVIHLTISL